MEDRHRNNKRLDRKSEKCMEKTSEQQLFHELETEYGFPGATCRSLVQLMHEFIGQNYGNQREDKQIIYYAASKDEPPGKQIDKIKIVPAKLTITHPEDRLLNHKPSKRGFSDNLLHAIYSLIQIMARVNNCDSYRII